MTSHTPAPPRSRAERERTDRVVIATEGEDYPDEAPTVMASDIRELGIDPDSLALQPDRTRRLRRQAQPPVVAPDALRRAREELRARNARASAPRGVSMPERDEVPEPPRDTTREDRIQLLTLVGLAALPVVLAFIAAVWLALA